MTLLRRRIDVVPSHHITASSSLFISPKSKSTATTPTYTAELLSKRNFIRTVLMASVAPASFVKEVLPPVLTSSSPPPSIFDGTTRLYVAYICPYAQRTWIARNYKGLQDKIKLVAIDLGDRPTWYKEKVYPENKVPSLEHNNGVKGESLDLIKYIDTHFEGASLFPEDPAKQAFAEELLAYSDSFVKAIFSSLLAKGEDISADAVAALNKLEESLSKFEDGPFFLGRDFSLVDIAYAPFVERFQIFLSDLKKYDITDGKPKLTTWIEELNKIDAYTATKLDPQVLLAYTKKRFGLA
ncbi:Glutathione S-transferase [Rhynchospora pubera]|uniref:Glutathione S-transferase n=1 Tax=Rhynchospora pubera TaxID=906938 RepID=A0AAV8CGM3_9POAL|nr:Glutathione S-transferase [Rhynchospora pubera]